MCFRVWIYCHCGGAKLTIQSSKLKLKFKLNKTKFRHIDWSREPDTTVLKVIHVWILKGIEAVIKLYSSGSFIRLLQRNSDSFQWMFQSSNGDSGRCEKFQRRLT